MYHVAEPFGVGDFTLLTSTPGWSKRSPHAVFWDGELFVVPAGLVASFSALQKTVEDNLAHLTVLPGAVEPFYSGHAYTL